MQHRPLLDSRMRKQGGRKLTKGVFTPGVFCEREKLSRPLFQQQKKLAALFVLKAPRAFFLSPSNEPTLDPDARPTTYPGYPYIVVTTWLETGD